MTAASEELARMKEKEEQISRQFDRTAKKAILRIKQALDALRAEGKKNDPGIEDEFEHSIGKDEE